MCCFAALGRDHHLALAARHSECLAALCHFQCAVTGKTYIYQVLPFGWRLSPYVFCRIMQTLTWLLRTSSDVSVPGRGMAESLLSAVKRY